MTKSKLPERSRAILQMIQRQPGISTTEIVRVMDFGKVQFGRALEKISGFVDIRVGPNRAHYYTAKGIFKPKPVLVGMPASRECIPMHQLPVYVGETRRAGALI